MLSRLAIWRGVVSAAVGGGTIHDDLTVRIPFPSACLDQCPNCSSFMLDDISTADVTLPGSDMIK